VTELSARLGMYAGIDRAAAGDANRLQAAAAVIPLYRLDVDASGDSEPRQGTVGWSSYLDVLLPEVPVPSIEAALTDLQGLTQPVDLDQARRLKAVWILTHVIDLPDTNRELLAEVLAPLVQLAFDERSETLAPSDTLARCQDLLELISAPDQADRSEDWPRLVQTALQQNLISRSVAELAVVGCDDWETYVPVTRNGYTDIDPAARIVVKIPNFDVGTRRLADIKATLQPGNWPHCLGSFWCSMSKVPVPSGVVKGPKSWYQEVVGDCPSHWFHPYLVFAAIDYATPSVIPNGFELQYDLCSPADLASLSAGKKQPLVQDTRVEADSGKIIVAFRQKPGAPAGHHEIDVTTSKTIRFQAPLPTGGVALLACICGWADQTRGMISGCLASKP
jgi:hypothetical protein